MTQNPRSSFLERLLAPRSELIYCALRVVLGFLIVCHGSQKVFGLLGGQPRPVLSQHWIGGILELSCGSLLFLGLFTRWAAFLLSGMLAVAYFQFHWQLRLDLNFFPIVNKGELAVAYCFLLLYIASRGGGRWSLDRK